MKSISCCGLLLLLVVAPSCARVKVGFTVAGEAPIKLEESDAVAIMQIQEVKQSSQNGKSKEKESATAEETEKEKQKEKFRPIEGPKELTDLTRRVLEEVGQFKTVKLIPLIDGGKTPADQPSQWIDSPDAIPWPDLEAKAELPLVIYGTLFLDAQDYLGYVTETVDDPYTGRPVRRTVQKQMATYKYEVNLALADIKTKKVAIAKKFDGTKTFEDKVNIYDFYKIFEPIVREFASLISGEKHHEKRSLLR
jgi:hypothetical protein